MRGVGGAAAHNQMIPPLDFLSRLPYIERAAGLVRDNMTRGPITSARELSLAGAVAPDTRRPPTTSRDHAGSSDRRPPRHFFGCALRLRLRGAGRKAREIWLRLATPMSRSRPQSAGKIELRLATPTLRSRPQGAGKTEVAPCDSDFAEPAARCGKFGCALRLRCRGAGRKARERPSRNGRKVGASRQGAGMAQGGL